MQIKQAQDQQKQKQKQAEAGSNLNLNLSLSNRIFQVDWNHRSKKTAAKYKTNFNHFLNFIRIHNLDVLRDLGKEAIQKLVIRYVLSMRDNPDKRYSRGTVNNRVSAILYFLDNNDIELNKRKIKWFYPSDAYLLFFIFCTNCHYSVLPRLLFLNIYS
jgi:hypothetical protein